MKQSKSFNDGRNTEIKMKPIQNNKFSKVNMLMNQDDANIARVPVVTISKDVALVETMASLPVVSINETKPKVSLSNYSNQYKSTPAGGCQTSYKPRVMSGQRQYD